MFFKKSAFNLLHLTSRTFSIPINHLPSTLKEAVTSAYLCMRAIDQIEDHPTLDKKLKVKLLSKISLDLQSETDESLALVLSTGLEQYQNDLEEVSLRIGEWALLSPTSIAPRIWDATSAMAERMAFWVDNEWAICNEKDLNRYTFSVAGTVGLLLSDLWCWYDGTQTDRSKAVGFGRGLQSVNILRNCAEDRARGVDFFPDGWTTEDMHEYARKNLEIAKAYNSSLPKGPILDFCQIPLILADHTLNALSQGKNKLSRRDVENLLSKVTLSSKI
uniref:Squalene synthase n=1 Tax=Prochloron didemni P2-Fiji TaxID=910454 RepID=G0XS49_PRODI|nr:squalene synthase [Prochloron didemni P2-Fiji]